jgi:pimeloyl-ACP methyl ester carboxylesterase
MSDGSSSSILPSTRMIEDGMSTYTAGSDPPTHELVLRDGRAISYGLYGAEDGPLVMVLDGPGSRGLGRAMGPAAEPLGVKLLVPDRPGFGRSTPVPDGSFATVAHDLIALVDGLGFARFGIVAQSGGTPYAVALACVGGDRVTGLAFVGGLAPLHESGSLRDVGQPMRSLFLLGRHAPWLVRPLLSGFARQAARNPQKVALKFAESMPCADREALSDPAIWAIHAGTIAEMFSRPAAWAREARMLGHPWSVNRDCITAPVALWVGELDRTHPLSMSRRLATLLGGAPVTVVPGAATFAMLTRYPDVLRHAAALPEHPAHGEPRAF